VALVALLAGCAQVPGKAAAQPGQDGAASQMRPPKPIPDLEPEVTGQIGAMLAQLATGALPDGPWTDRQRAALSPEALQSLGALLRPCPQAFHLDLLERHTKGEDRQYLYRIGCGPTPLLMAVDFNKAARINKLEIHRE
jgi:hypothetical protein